MAVTRQLQRQVLTTYLKDIKALNTGGGAVATGAFNNRTLNTLTGDSTNVSLSGGTTGTGGTADRFTLTAGVYTIKARVPFGLINGNEPQLTKVRLFNITDSVTALVGDNSRLGDGDTSELIGAFLFIDGQLTLTTSKTFAVQYQCSAGNAVTNTLGIPANLTEVESYTSVEINKLA